MLHALLSAGSKSVDIALIVVLVLTLWETYRGYRRGVKRQVLHTLFMGLAALLAFTVTNGMADSIIAELGNMNADEIIIGLESGFAPEEVPAELAETIRSMDLGILTYVLSMPLALFVPPIMFFLLFVLFALIAKLACFIVTLLLGLILGEKNHRELGLVVGAIEGFAMAVILLIPFAGISGLVTEAVEVIADEETVETEDGEEMLVYEESGTIRMVRKLGGDAMIRSFATVEIDGVEYDLAAEFGELMLLLGDATLLEDADFTALTDEEKATLDGILDRVYDSTYFTNLCSGALQILGGLVSDSTLGLEIEDDYLGLVTAMAGVFTKGNADVFETDMEALKSAYYILSDNGILAAITEGGDALSEAMTKTDAEGKTAISRVTAILNKNDRTRPIVTELTKLSLKLICDNSDTVTAELYENVKSGVADTLAIDKTSYSDPEEYKAAVTASLDTTLKENDINLDEDVIADIADYIDKNYDDLKDATDEQINEIILSYHEAYMEYLNSQNSPDESVTE